MAVLALVAWLAGAHRVSPLVVPVAALIAVAANEALARLPAAVTVWATVGEARRRVDALAREGARLAPSRL